MIQFIDNLATYLQTQGHGTLGSTIFKGNSPEGNTSNIIIVNDTGGIPHPDIAGVELITVQIVARNKKQEQARDSLLAIQEDLHRLVNTDLGTFSIIGCRAVSRPSVLGRDPVERWQLVLNLEILARTN